MAKLEFNKDPKRGTKKITETKISEPKKVFSLEDMIAENDTEKKATETTTSATPSTPKMGRPRKNKIYSTMRIQQQTISRVNSLQNTLDYETQDDLIAAALDRLENSLDTDQKTMYTMYMKTYESKNKRKQK